MIAKRLRAIKRSYRKLERAAQMLREAREKVSTLVDGYEKARLALFDRALKEREMGWCGLCDAVRPNRELAPLYMTTYSLTSENYRADVIANEFFSACPQCLERSGNGQAAFRRDSRDWSYGVECEFLKVEKRADGYWVAEPEVWEMLPGVDPKLVWPDETVEFLSLERVPLEEKRRRMEERRQKYMRPQPIKWFPLPKVTTMRFLPKVVSAKCGKALCLPPRVEFVPRGGVSSANTHLAAYIGGSPEDHLIIGDRD